MKIKSLLLILCMLLTSCSMVSIQLADVTSTKAPGIEPTSASIPNPASVYCEQQGYKSEIRTAADGSQSGVCIFSNNSECDEWAFYRGECAPAEQSTEEQDPAAAFCEMLGYTIELQATDDGTQVTTCRFPDGSSCDPTALLKGECVPISQLASMPNPASAYCKEQGFTSEIRTASDGSQSGVCIFADGSQCDEWAYFRGECDSGTSMASNPTPIPTAVPIEASYYQGFWTYTNPEYGFSIMLPEDWVLDETTTFDPLMNGHVLIFHPAQAADVHTEIRMAYRNVGEDALLWPTGVGQGEFIPGGTLEVAGAPTQRSYLVCPTGQINSIWYHGGENQPNIQRGNMEFGFIYTYSGVYCEGDYSLTGKVQLVGEMIIASLQAP